MSHLNSLDPQLINNPEEASIRFRELTRQRYLLSKHTHTSYIDTGVITPVERQYMFEFITEELQKQKDAYDKYKREAEERKR